MAAYKPYLKKKNSEAHNLLNNVVLNRYFCNKAKKKKKSENSLGVQAHKTKDTFGTADMQKHTLV